MAARQLDSDFVMKTLIRGLLFSLLVFLPFSSPTSAKTYHGQVIKVFDGDTVLVRIKGHEEFVRLREIDAPEMSGRKLQGQEPWGRKAREFALSRLKDRKVRLETEDREERDAYGRLLAYVFVEDSFLNREMVRSGNAFFYRAPIRGKYAGRLEEAEDAYRRSLQLDPESASTHTLPTMRVGCLARLKRTRHRSPRISRATPPVSRSSRGSTEILIARTALSEYVIRRESVIS